MPHWSALTPGFDFLAMLTSSAHKHKPTPHPSSWSESAWRARGQKFHDLSVCIYPPGFVSEGVRICVKGTMQLPLYINLINLTRWAAHLGYQRLQMFLTAFGSRSCICESAKLILISQSLEFPNCKKTFHWKALKNFFWHNLSLLFSKQFWFKNRLLIF